jgi:hypothetical protein
LLTLSGLGVLRQGKKRKLKLKKKKKKKKKVKEISARSMFDMEAEQSDDEEVSQSCFLPLSVNSVERSLILNRHLRLFTHHICHRARPLIQRAWSRHKPVSMAAQHGSRGPDIGSHRVCRRA